MKGPCGHENSSVIDVRPSPRGGVKRRRACDTCGLRFTTRERLEYDLKTAARGLCEVARTRRKVDACARQSHRAYGQFKIALHILDCPTCLTRRLEDIE